MLHYQLIQHLRTPLNTSKIVIFCRQYAYRLTVTGLRLYILLATIVDIARLYQYSRLLHACLRSLVYRQAVLHQRLIRIPGSKIDIAHRAVDIVQLIFVLRLFRHLSQLFERRLALQLSNTNTRIKIHLHGRRQFNHLLISVYRFLPIAFILIELTQHILETRAIHLPLLIGSSNLDKREGRLVLLRLYQNIRTHRRIQRSMLPVQVIHLHLVQHILCLIQPSQLSIRASNPQLTTGNHVRVVLIMFHHIRESTDGTEEICLVKLRLTQSYPRIAHLRIELLRLEPQLVFRVIAFLRVGLRFLLDRVQLNALSAFLYRYIHLGCRRRGRLMVAHGI